MTDNQTRRSNILKRLRANAFDYQRDAGTQAAETVNWHQDEKIRRFSDCMTAVHGEVQIIKKADWLSILQQQLQSRQLHKLLLPDNQTGQQIKAFCRDSESHIYHRDIETFKAALFSDFDVAITGCRAAIAQTGSLVFWPDSQEPRLMSLVPPIHIVLLPAEAIFNTFAEVIEKQQWRNGMPSNALLISGPSKTADIEQTLAYGIHGPKQLVVLILT